MGSINEPPASWAEVRDKIIEHYADGGSPGAREWWPEAGGCSCSACMESQGCDVPILVRDVTGLEATSSPLYADTSYARARRQRMARSVVDVAMSMPTLEPDNGKLMQYVRDRTRTKR